MKYIDCIKVAALYLDDDDLNDYLANKGTSSEDIERKIRYLCAFIDLIANEISCEYFPVLAVEKVQATEGRINFDQLSRKIVDVRWLKKNGQKVNYDFYAFAIGVDEDGEYDICYEYSPNSFDGNLESNIELYGRITSRIVGIGAAAEYCLAFDRFDEAIIYDKMFKDALVGVEKSRGKLKIKQRSWA